MSELEKLQIMEELIDRLLSVDSEDFQEVLSHTLYNIRVDMEVLK